MSITMTKAAQRDAELQIKLLRLFRQHSPSTISKMYELLPDYDRDDIAAGVASLFLASKLEPVSSSGLGFDGPLKCELRPTAM